MRGLVACQYSHVASVLPDRGGGDGVGEEWVDVHGRLRPERAFGLVIKALPSAVLKT